MIEAWLNYLNEEFSRKIVRGLFSGSLLIRFEPLYVIYIPEAFRIKEITLWAEVFFVG